MAVEIQGDRRGEGLSIGVVVSKFNWRVTSRLLEGAREALSAHGIRDEDITVAHVPGSFEIPLAAKKMAESGRYHAVVCLGAVIKGETDHYDFIAAEAARGIGAAALSAGVPITFGVLTTHDVGQAMDRAGGEHGNAGYKAAVAAIEMANLLKALETR